MDLKYLIVLIFINVVFLIIGGIVFHVIEGPPEESAIKDSDANYGFLLQELSKNVTCMTEEELDELIHYVVQEYDNGKILVDDRRSWDISGAIFFSTTVITTIGYGHISPQTSGGRVFCIFFALLGIPLCLIMLGEIGMRLSQLGQRLDKRLNHGWFPQLGKYFRPLLISVLGFSLFILVPAALMTLVEDWNYGIAVYYGIISLTTIGFGDFVAGQDVDNDYSWLYNIAISCWILIGLAWVANLIANCQEIYKDIGEVIESEDEESKDHAIAAQDRINQAQDLVMTKEDAPLVDNTPPTSYSTHQPGQR